MKRRIRNSIKALIIKDGKMPVIKMCDEGKIFYIMPGGGQDAEETMEQAVRREVAEELGMQIYNLYKGYPREVYLGNEEMGEGDEIC